MQRENWTEKIAGTCGTFMKKNLGGGAAVSIS